MSNHDVADTCAVLFVITLACVLTGLAVQGCTDSEVRQEAARHGAGAYLADPVNGKTTFQWITTSTNR